MSINHDASALHKQAANDHEAAAQAHHKAAECHAENQTRDAIASSEKAMECCDTAQKKSKVACACSAK